MEWIDVLSDKSLQNLPYKIELNRRGKIIMSPASNIHGGAQFRIGNLIEKYREDGEVIPECSIETIDGVKVADVC